MTNNDNKEVDKEARDYQKKVTLAFFIANFGFTKRDFEELTESEIAFTIKAWENKQVLDSQLMANAFYNAYSNANRKKNARAVPLWKKKSKKTDIDKLKKQYLEVLEYEQNNSNDWIRKIYTERG